MFKQTTVSLWSSSAYLKRQPAKKSSLHQRNTNYQDESEMTGTRKPPNITYIPLIIEIKRDTTGLSYTNINREAPNLESLMRRATE